MEEEIRIAAGNLANPNVCKTDNWIEGAMWMYERLRVEAKPGDYCAVCESQEFWNDGEE